MLFRSDAIRNGGNVSIAYRIARYVEPQTTYTRKNATISAVREGAAGAEVVLMRVARTGALDERRPGAAQFAMVFTNSGFVARSISRTARRSSAVSAAKSALVSTPVSTSLSLP